MYVLLIYCHSEQEMCQGLKKRSDKKTNKQETGTTYRSFSNLKSEMEMWLVYHDHTTVKQIGLECGLALH